MIEWLNVGLFGITLLVLIWASATDLKERIVNDWAPYLLLIIGAALFLIQGIFFNNWNWLVIGSISAAALFAFSYFLWRIGFWAGGDVKLFAAIAFANPVNWLAVPALLGTTPFFAEKIAYGFPFFLFIFSVLALLPVGIVFATGKIIKKPAFLKEIFPNSKKRVAQLIVFSFFVAGSEATLTAFGFSQWWVLALIAGFGFLPLKNQASLGIGFGITGIFLEQARFVVGALELLAALAVAWIVLKIAFSMPKLFRSQKSVLDLKEGDIPAVTIAETKNGIETREEKGFVETLKNLKKQGLVKTAPETIREICSSRRAGGLEKEQITELQQLARENKIPNQLAIKESTAFVPAILAAYVFLNLAGNPLWMLW